MVYAVTAKTGYYEHERDKVMCCPKFPYALSELCTGETGDRFFFGPEGEMRIILAADFYEGREITYAKSRALPQVPLIKNYTCGDCDSLSCLHMYRCSNCRRPLLYPLVSTNQEAGVKTCYCSPECQAGHWPKFVATRQPVRLLPS
jgi:hypothetical protein